ncbi:hypothetical protein Bpfe_006788 [Biomphalaria pfeifferi]|uniref:Uncharacterized protein n=1 Tax=Biomphalaria pfeifferi TaxID=112525 RepID=A0AAD8C0T5_BIOPF|nr:hypothetical protein Bpfe_006788 [Biomphalaria pfeifferi]
MNGGLNDAAFSPLLRTIQRHSSKHQKNYTLAVGRNIICTQVQIKPPETAADNNITLIKIATPGTCDVNNQWQDKVYRP